MLWYDVTCWTSEMVLNAGPGFIESDNILVGDILG